MPEETEKTLKNYLIHILIEFAEEQEITRQEAASVLCELSHDLRSDDFGNLFKGEK